MTLPVAILQSESVQFLLLHTSNTPPGKHITLADIARAHRSEGKLSIGYHFVIRRDGQLEHGRPLDRMGAHRPGYNDKSIGICLVGGVDTQGASARNFTEVQMETLSVLLDTLKVRFPKAVSLESSPNKIIL